MTHTNKKSGFTLVELAIVLVIIGLIVGGVLAGADLIKAATLSKTIKQVSDTESGAATFRTKYNALPGDLANAASVFPDITGGVPGAIGLGNANSLIEAAAAATGGQTPTAGVSGEVAAFYAELNRAGYITQTMAAVDMTEITRAQASLNSNTFLASALGKGAKLMPFSANGRNHLLIVGDFTGAAAAGVAPIGAGLEPLEASSIDGKLDDGVPTTGNVLAAGDASGAGTITAAVAVAGADASTGCYFGTAYNATVETQVCSLNIRTSF